MLFRLNFDWPTRPGLAIDICEAPFLVEGAECIADAFENIGNLVVCLLGGSQLRLNKGSPVQTSKLALFRHS